LRIAMWDTFLLLVVAVFSLAAPIDVALGVSKVRQSSDGALLLALFWFWAVALCTALFSSVSERDLRRSRAELAALADLSVHLEESHDVEEILTTLLRNAVEVFGAPRGALYWGSGGTMHSFVGSSRLGAPAEIVAQPVLSGPSVFDAVVLGVWAAGSPAMVRHLDPVADPLLASLLPAAHNVIIVPLAAEGGQGGVLALVWGGHWRERVSRHSLTVLGQFSAHATLALRNARLVAELARMAAMDSLTSLANRREFELTLAREVHRAVRTGEMLSLIIFDVDHFKQVNDRRGHLAGDGLLVTLARAMEAHVREMDVVARFGGEEFAVILPCCDADHAAQVAERIRGGAAKIRGLEAITLSAGVASFPQHTSNGVELTAAADAALYAAKAAGRDRVEVASRFSAGPH
jgi:diguanylate cyclase (GGDEF)-like protein